MMSVLISLIGNSSPVSALRRLQRILVGVHSSLAVACVQLSGQMFSGLMPTPWVLV